MDREQEIVHVLSLLTDLVSRLAVETNNYGDVADGIIDVRTRIQQLKEAPPDAH